MNLSINFFIKCLDDYPTIKQWGWFAILWLAGLIVALSMAYPIKWLMKWL